MKPREILIIEDHPFQGMYLQRLLTELGEVHVDMARDGGEALQRLRQREYGLVLTDLMMPGMDRVQFIQKLATLPGKPGLAIMSSASRRMLTGASLVAKHLGIEVVGLLSKPVSSQALRGVVEHVRDQRRSTRPAAPKKVEYDRLTLIDALESRALQAWFQPKKSLSTGRIVSAEALARWMHPTQGVMLPGAFIPSVKASGLEERLLWLVLEQSLEVQAHWRARGFDVPVSINLPTHLLNDHDLADRLWEFVVRHKGVPGKISFELMECSMPEQVSNYYAGACRLRMKGFGLSQDDFGKGYSSYVNLLSIPFTELKIDRALVQGCHEDDNLRATLSSIVELAKRLSLSVVAEGVENAAELALLRKIGCSHAQGFLISHAVPADQFLHLLKVDGSQFVH
ncbi:Bacteriophytochrome cph2 [Achromobacter insolitus]|uniref:EAL domain-containing response regulator n=1 Tax=Achromobacter insolitus TaxID=217204 RepID=UPI000972BBB8|nr:EAL domain-containing protein [Achromobacter insolitus]APX76997.1 diguanylate phosphodiesterase [Achromobacter insolitus]OWT65161.1 diguanylate phosphodiesterase [Achromobacter insolitus]CAB3736811.1 Sensor histidine kinase RcsC [Achromobacter insolitus]VEG71698.1 Bacteriophytochrome cph2 [Achromobacter insolitus]